MNVYIMCYVIITCMFLLLSNRRFSLAVTSWTLERSYDIKMRQQKKLFVFVSCMVLIGVIGLRSEYQGIDLHNSVGTGYFYVYDIVCGDTVGDIFRFFNVKRYANFEIGYVLFNKAISVITKEHWILLFATSLISIAPVGYFIYHNSKNAWLSFVVYMSLPFFTSAYFSAIRQGIAIGMAVYSYKYIKGKKLLAFLLVTILATQFHKSAIVYFLAYPIYHIKLKKRDSLMLGGIIIGFFYILRVPLFMLLSKIIRSSVDIDNNGAVNYLLLLTGIYMLCVLFGDEHNSESCGLRNLFLLGCFSQAFAGVYSTAGRVTWFFLPVLIILIPNLLEELKIKERQIVKPISWVIGVLAIVLGLYYLRYDMIADAYPYVPYWRQ